MIKPWLPLAGLVLLLHASAWSQAAGARLDTLELNGPVDNRINLVISGDGFREKDLPAFRTLCKKLFDNTFMKGAGADSFYTTFRKMYNGFAISVPSQDSGIDQNPPATENLKNTYFEGYLMPLTSTSKQGRYTTQKFEDLIKQLIPQADIKVMILNSGGFRAQGGSRITFSNNPSGATLGHEMGHNVGKLADEYVDAGLNLPCSEGRNATAVTVREQIKWSTWILPTTPIPTPPVAANNELIGLVEGASYTATGCYRPKIACKMKNNSPPYCAVCMEHMIREIYNKVNPIDQRSPAPATVTMNERPGLDFSITPILPVYGHYTYAWTLNGAPIAGAVGPRHTLVNLAPGNYVLKAILKDANPAVRMVSPMLSDTAAWNLTVIPGVSVRSGESLARNSFWQENDASLLKYSLQDPSRVELIVRNLGGREILRFDQGLRPGGPGEMRLPAALGPGLYFYTLKATPAGRKPFVHSLKALHF